MIEDWLFSGVSFDGIHPADCHLYWQNMHMTGFYRWIGWLPLFVAVIRCARGRTGRANERRHAGDNADNVLAGMAG
jgi:hypothetical protein